MLTKPKRLLTACLAAIAFFSATGAGADAGTQAMNARNRQLTIHDKVHNIADHPAFHGFGPLLLPWDDNTPYLDTPLTDVGSLMPYHSHVTPAVVVAALNHMVDEVGADRPIFYDFYTERQKQASPDKSRTGLFFFRGRPGAPFAVVCPGGGFAYVGSLHEGFPYAWELSKQGYNAFVLKYRAGSGRKAVEDLAAALSFIFRHAVDLGVGTEHYSVWGSSAGARMASAIGSYGAAAYGGDNLPRPDVVVMAYTGQSEFTRDDPRTFMTVSADDLIAPASVVQRRATAMRQAGIDVELRAFRHAGHGFGLGTGTDAEGWLEYAVAFWEKSFR